jgi:hypothetical protein
MVVSSDIHTRRTVRWHNVARWQVFTESSLGPARSAQSLLAGTPLKSRTEWLRRSYLICGAKMGLNERFLLLLVFLVVASQEKLLRRGFRLSIPDRTAGPARILQAVPTWWLIGSSLVALVAGAMSVAGLDLLPRAERGPKLVKRGPPCGSFKP